MPGVELFDEGIYRGRPYTDAEIDELIRNFDRFGPAGMDLLKPTVVLGHEDDQEFLDRSDLPAAGYVARLRKSAAGKLIADFEHVPVPIGGLVNAKAYSKVSIEHYDEDRPFDAGDGRVFTDLILRRVALLGGELPQVKTLADLPVAVFTYGDRQIEVLKLPPTGSPCFVFSERTVPTMPAPSKTITTKTIDKATLTAALKTKPRFATCFADGALDRNALLDRIKAALPGVDTATLDGLDDQQLMGLALGCPPMPDTSTTSTTGAADATPTAFDRATVIGELVAAGEDAAKLEAMTDDELKALYAQKMGVQYKDKPVSTPTPTPPTSPPKPTPTLGSSQSPEAAKLFAEQQAELDRLKRTNAELDAANKRGKERAKEARKEHVAAFCDGLVKQGRLVPAQRPIVERNLVEADDVEPSHNFSENGKTVKLTAYEALRRELAAWPVVVKMGERLRSDGKVADANAEVEKVVRFCEDRGDDMRKHGSDPRKLIEFAKKKAAADPNFTARAFLGEGAVAE